MKKQLFLLSTFALLLASCSTQQPISTSGNTNAHHPSENAVLWHQTAAEYDALCYQAYNIAKSNLEEYKSVGPQGGDMPPAIIMDLDETVLDNSAYNARLVLENKKHTEERWNSWVKEMKAELVPGARDFIHYAQEVNIPIFFISNRSEETLQYTVDNLQQVGIDVQPDKLFLKSESSQKASRRKRVISEYYVIMLIGDNLADFEDLFEEETNVTERNEFFTNVSSLMGSRYIILPNTMYGNWLNALKFEDSKARNQSNEFKGNKRYLNPAQ